MKSEKQASIIQFYCFSNEEVKQRCSDQCATCKKKEFPLKKTKRKNLKSTSISLSPEIYNEVERLSVINNRSVSNTIETLIKNQLGKLNCKFTI